MANKSPSLAPWRVESPLRPGKPLCLCSQQRHIRQSVSNHAIVLNISSSRADKKRERYTPRGARPKCQFVADDVAAMPISGAACAFWGSTAHKAAAQHYTLRPLTLRDAGTTPFLLLRGKGQNKCRTHLYGRYGIPCLLHTTRQSCGHVGDKVHDRLSPRGRGCFL